MTWTPERTAQVRARVNAASDVPWARYGDGLFEVYDPTEYDDGGMGGYITYGSPREADAEFIAHARQDVPDLLDEIERLRGEIDTLDALLADARTVTDEMVERAARAISAGLICVGELGSPDIVYGEGNIDVRAALDAALNPEGEE